MSTRKAGHWLLIGALAVLGLGFVGWMLQAPVAPNDATTSDRLQQTDETRDPVAGDDTSGPVVKDVPTLALKRLVDPHGGLNLNQALRQLQASNRASGRVENLARPMPGVAELVAQAPSAWSDRALGVAQRLANQRKGLSEDHALLSVLEALGPVSGKVVAQLTLRLAAFRMPSAESDHVQLRIVELIAQSLGPDKFLAWAIEVMRSSKGRWGAPVGAKVGGKMIVMMGHGMSGRKAVMAVLARLSSDSPAFAERVRAGLLDMAANSYSYLKDAAILATFGRGMAFGSLGDPKAGYLGTHREDAVLALGDEHPFVLYHAVRALHVDGATPVDVLRPALLRVMSCQFPLLRKHAIELAPFIVLKLDDAIPTLNTMLSSMHPGVVADAPIALARLATRRGDAPIGRLVGRILSRSKTPVRKKLISDLTQFRLTVDEERQILSEYIGDRDSTVRLAVVEALGYLGQRNPKEAGLRQLLAQAQRDSDARVRESASAWIEEFRLAGEAEEEDQDSRKTARSAFR